MPPKAFRKISPCPLYFNIKSSLPNSPFLNPCHWVSKTTPSVEAIYDPDYTMKICSCEIEIFIMSPRGCPVRPSFPPSEFEVNSLTKRD